MPLQLPRWTGGALPAGMAAWVNSFAGVLERALTAGAQLGVSAAPNGPAAGDLGGTYPAPTVAKVGGGALAAHAVPVSEGGAATQAVGPGAAALPLVAQGTAADPAFRALTNAGLAAMPASTLKGNDTGASATPADLAAAQVLALLGIAQATPLSNSLAADVALTSSGVYEDGPSVAQGGTGTWFASGTVTMNDTSGAATFGAKLWDGTTVIASGVSTTSAGGRAVTISLSGFLPSPAGNLRISVTDANASPAGAILHNASGNGKDSTITACRIA